MTIKRKDIYEGGKPFKEAIDDAQKLETQLKSVIDNLDKLGTALQKDLKKPILDSAAAIKKNTEVLNASKTVLEQKKKATETLSRLEKERNKIQEKTRQQLAKNLAQNEKGYKILQKGIAQNQRRQKDIKQIIALQKAERGSIEQLKLVTNTLIKRRDKLNLQTSKGREQYERLTRAIARNDKQQKAAKTVLEQKQKAVKSLTEYQKIQQKLEKQLATEIAKTNSQETKRNKELQKAKAINQSRKKDIKQIIALQKAERGSIEQLRLVTNRLVKKRDQVNQQTEKGRLQYERLTRAIARNDKQLKAHDSAIGRNQRHVGDYGRALGGLRKGFGTLALGITAGIAVFRTVGRVIGSTIRTFTSFVDVTAKVAAISGASGKELVALSKQARELGRTSQNSASQVAQLQLELSKLGFNPEEIQAATESINALSIATGEDLANSAKVVAGNVKAFGLEASDAGRVADVMAAGFSSSALDLEKFKIATAAAGTVLKTSGRTVEEMTAQLGVLVDRNLDASTAGTSLRNIYLELSNQGISLSEAFDRINSASDPASAALQLFGKRGATAGVILAQNQKEVAALTDQLNNSAGAAKRMADIMADNLAGDTKAAASAVEGLQIAIGTRLNSALRGLTQGFTSVVNSITEFIGLDNEVVASIKAERDEVSELTVKLKSNLLSREDEQAALQKLKSIQPDIFANIKKEDGAYVGLTSALNKYNQEVVKKIAIAELEQEISDILRESQESEADAIQNLIDAQDTFNQVSDKYPSLRSYIVEDDDAYRQLSLTMTNLEDNFSFITETMGLNERQTNALREAFISIDRELVDYTENLGKSIELQQGDELGMLQVKIARVSQLILGKKEENKIVQENTKVLNENGDAVERVTGLLEKLSLRGVGAGEDLSKLSSFIDDFTDSRVPAGIEEIDDTIRELVDGVDLAAANFQNLGVQAQSALSPELLESLISDPIDFDSVSEQFDRYREELEELYEDGELTEQEYARASKRINQDLFRQRLDKASEYFDAVSSIAQQSSNFVNNLVQLEQMQYQDSADATEEEREKNAEKRKQIEKKYADLRLATTVAEIISATALGVARALTIPFGGPALAALISANGLVQLAIAKKQRDQVASLGTGGFIDDYGVITGDRHSAPSGGEDFKDHIKVEDGEGASVWNRKTTRKNGSALKDLTKQINNGLDVKALISRNSDVGSSNIINNFDTDKIVKEQRETNSLLRKSKSYYRDAKGRLIEVDIMGNKKKHLDK